MKLRDYLDEHKLSAAEFAARIDVSETSVHRYIAGRVPRPTIVRAIVVATEGDVCADDFYGDD